MAHTVYRRAHGISFPSVVLTGPSPDRHAMRVGCHHAAGHRSGVAAAARRR
jgi:hypothetical protein